MITVLLADDHALLRNSLSFLLEAAGDIQIVATASNGAEAILQASFYCPDVAIIDISMPLIDGIEAARQICAGCPHTRVMMLSVDDSQEYVHRALQGGASGYVLKETAGSDLVAAVRSLSKGNRYFSEKIVRFVEPYPQQKGNNNLPI
jgi:DNA-binding NarL/FixJ family response regulator